jgi:hypothetical protein
LSRNWKHEEWGDQVHMLEPFKSYGTVPMSALRFELTIHQDATPRQEQALPLVLSVQLEAKVCMNVAMICIGFVDGKA